MDSCSARMTEMGQGEDDGCQRSLCGPGRGVESRGAGNHLRVPQASASTPVRAEREIIRRVSAGIRFYAGRAEREIRG